MAETAYPTRRRAREEPRDVDDTRAEAHHDERAATHETTHETTGRPPITPMARDRIRWGAVWGGLLAALGTFMILATGAVAIGALAVDAEAGIQAGTASAWVSAIIGLVAFLIGGLVAGWTAGVLNPIFGAVNGVMVWALSVGILLILTAFGLGTIFGAAGELFAQFQQLQTFQLQNVETAELVSAIQNTAIGAFLAMIIPAAAAALGGWLGVRMSPERVEA
jgi:hypothetical protein